MFRVLILGLAFLTLGPAWGQTSDFISVGNVRLRLGMSQQEVLATLSPYEVHAANSDVLLGYLAGVPITPCEGDNVGCIVTQIGQAGKGGGTLAGLLFRGNHLVYVIKALFSPSKSAQPDVILAQNLYGSIAALVNEQKTNCALKTTTSEEPNEYFKSALIVCGQRAIDINLISWGSNGGPGGLAASLYETLGAVPKR